MKKRFLWIALALAMILSGCGFRTVGEMYAPPRRSAEYQELQKAIDDVMPGLEYCAPLSGENQQTVQAADLDGDGENEYVLFAKSPSQKNLRILIFGRGEQGYELKASMECPGAAFERVEYVAFDGQSGAEIVVGRQVSEQVLRSLSVYHLSENGLEQRLSAGYFKFATPDLDGDGQAEILVISSGDTETDNASAVLYQWKEDAIRRSAEVSLSGPAGRIKRMMVSKLHGGVNAVYVASAVEENAMATDVFALRDGEFTNISRSHEPEEQVKTLRNYFVYADDIDGDGVLELPRLITMAPLESKPSAQKQYLICWYALRMDGETVEKQYTFHNYESGWYLQLQKEWASRLSVTQDGSTNTFYIWDKLFRESQPLLTIYALTGADRETVATEDGRFALYWGDSVVYAAKLEAACAALDITPEKLIECFHLIQLDWNTGET